MSDRQTLIERFRSLCRARKAGSRRTVVVDAARCDVFASDRRITDVAAAFAMMSLHPDLIYQVSTIHPGRAASLLSSDHFWSCVHSQLDEVGPHDAVIVADGQQMLANLHLGVPARSQPELDIRLTSLLDTPLVARFLDARPLRGSLSLQRTFDRSPQHRRRRDVAQLDWVVACADAATPSPSVVWTRLLQDQCARLGIPFYVDSSAYQASTHRGALQPATDPMKAFV